MPFLLEWNTYDSRTVDWQLSEDSVGADLVAKDYREPDFIPGRSKWPIRVQQKSSHKSLPDLMEGTGLNCFFVNQKLRRLIERWDPIDHHYVSLSLMLKDGSTLENEYFLFKFGHFIDDGLEPGQSKLVRAKSSVTGKVREGERARYMLTELTPTLYWHEEKIKGRHIWADRLLKDRVSISDEFAEALSVEGIEQLLLTKGEVVSKP